MKVTSRRKNAPLRFRSFRRFPCGCSATRTSQKSNDAHNMVDNRTPLTAENSARYRNINTYVFSRLSRLSLNTGTRLLWTLSRSRRTRNTSTSLLLPGAGDPLGHQHWYAFRENYFEFDPDGKPVEGSILRRWRGRLRRIRGLTILPSLIALRRSRMPSPRRRRPCTSPFELSFLAWGCQAIHRYGVLADFAHMLRC